MLKSQTLEILSAWEHVENMCIHWDFKLQPIKRITDLKYWVF